MNLANEERNNVDPNIIQTIETGVAASHAGTSSFGDIVSALAGCGVESYHADFRLRSTTYYLPSGESHTVGLETAASPIEATFDGPAMIAAIRGAQSGLVKYPEFLTRAMKAGCVGYIVWIAGRHVTYFGRRGETHIERFPPK